LFSIFSSNLIKFSTKSTQSLSSKNSQVFHSIFVSKSPPAFNAKSGVQQAKASTGAIQKSSSHGKINHLAAANNSTISSQYFGQRNSILFLGIIPPFKGGLGGATIFSNSHL